MIDKNERKEEEGKSVKKISDEDRIEARKRKKEL